MGILENATVVALLSLVAFGLGYVFYSRYLAHRIFQLDPSEKAPAREFEDGVDYVPANKHVLFGHHFCSITGAAPIVGPAVAVLWGWLPAVIWVVLGTIFIGAVHDFGTLVLSVRHEGRSIGDICGEVIGPRSRFLFLLLVSILIWLVLAVFAVVIGTLFVEFPESVVPVNFEILVAVVIGIVVYRMDWDLKIPSIIALVALYAVIFLTLEVPALKNFQITYILPFSLEGVGWMETIGMTSLKQKKIFTWVVILLGYSFVASVIPVWVLLQPRDYINGHQLYIGLGALYLGLLIASPQIKSPKWNEKAGYPGAMGVFSIESETPPSRIPDGLVLLPEGTVPSENGNGTQIKREDIRNTSPRFIVVGSITGDKLKKNSSHPIRSLTQTEGNGFVGTLVPALAGDGTAWVHREGSLKRMTVRKSGGEQKKAVTGELASTGITVSTKKPVKSAPPILPFLFITIACGAISGFHGLVSSGTTSKQLADVTHSRYIGYGGMVGEGMLGLMAVFATTAGFSLLAEGQGIGALELWRTHYSSWGGANDFGAKIGAFVKGGSQFVEVLGLPADFSQALVAIIVISFAATTLDSATRIQRYILNELADVVNTELFSGRIKGSALAAFSPIFLVFGSAWGALWPLFGATNQMLAGLSLMVVTVYLFRNRRQVRNYLFPMIFLVLMTGFSLVLQTISFFRDGFLESATDWQARLLTVLSFVLFTISVWIVGEGFLQISSGEPVESEESKSSSRFGS